MLAWWSPFSPRMVRAMGKLVVWVCGACGHISNTQEDAYARGCGTWSVEVLSETIERDSRTGRVVKATAVVVIHELEVKAKVTL